MQTNRAVALCFALLFTIGSGACGDDATDSGAETEDEIERTTTSVSGATTTAAGNSFRAPASVSLIDVGIELPKSVIEFGAPMDETVTKIKDALGDPSDDTGVAAPQRPYGKCPGTKLRAVRYYGGALELLFGDAGANSKGGKLVFHSWVLTSTGDRTAAPKASVLIGDVTVFDFGVGTTVKQFKEGLDDPGGYSFEIFDQVGGGPTFVVANEEAGNDPGPDAPGAIFGELSSESDTGSATLVEAGEGCNE